MMVDPADSALDTLCPMHACLDGDGRIRSAGPTLRKVLGEAGVTGMAFDAVFDIRRPQNVTSASELLRRTGEKLKLRLRAPPHLELKGTVLPWGTDGRFLVNLSFGINVVDAVREFNLTAADFAVTDLTVEMLYLVEAKSAAMDASRKLNSKLQSARETAERQAFTDALTGLGNRRAMDAALQALLATGEAFALMHMDLDFFKSINDSLGHAAGDHVLTRVAEILRAETRADDVVTRLGGDEFVLIYRGLVDRQTLARIADRIIERLSRPIDFGTGTGRVSASIGTAVSSDYPTPDADVMLVDADLALYEAKRAGRACHRFFRPVLRDASAREAI